MPSTRNNLAEIFSVFSSATNPVLPFCAYLHLRTQDSVAQIAERLEKQFGVIHFVPTERFDEFPAQIAEFAGYSLALLESRLSDSEYLIEMQILPLDSIGLPVDVSERLADWFQQVTSWRWEAA